MNYLDIGFSPLGIRTISSATRQTPQETRNSALPGALISDGVFIGSTSLKIDKDGIYLGTAVPAYEEGRVYFNFTTHKLIVGGQSGFETITSA